MQASQKNKFHIALFCAWVAVCGGLGLAAYRWWQTHAKYPEYRRFLMWSSPHFMRDENGAVHYKPNEDVREVAVYNDRIEYDVSYHTNNYGLIDNENYAPDPDLPGSAGHIAFVGDSFTAGSGAKPWVPRLRDKLRKTRPGFQIYNLGVSGTGFLNYELLLKNLSKDFKYSRILILAISNDFSRGHWWPLVQKDEIRFCADFDSAANCLKSPPMATIIPYNAAKKDIFSHLAGRADNKSKVVDTAGSKSSPLSDAIRESVNIMALDKIKKEFPGSRITLIHLPQKEEVLSGAYLQDVEKIARVYKIDYWPALTKCAWRADMYHPHDPHPNEKGYEAISACVEKFLLGDKL